MDSINKRAISEVIEVLNHTEKETVEKIPDKFIKFLFENSDSEYISNIDFYDNNWEKNIDEDTKALLAIIYRDYIVSKDERNELLAEEVEERKLQEEKLREKYNPDNIFKKNNYNESKINMVNNMQLMEIKETPWYKRLYQKILSIFGRKNI